MAFARNAATFLVPLLLAAPAAAGVTREGDFRIEYRGKDIGPYTGLDTSVESWMTANDIHAAELAVRNKGTLIFSHAYTMGKKYDLVRTTNVFRLASVSKMLVTAAYTELLDAGTLTGNEHVFRYLGIKKALLKSQTPDPRINEITVQELEAHTSGLPGEGAGDPLFEMRDIEIELGKEPLTAEQFARFLYGVPLGSNPGQTVTYSNVGYFLLAEVIRKAAGIAYDDYVQQTLLHPLGLKNWTLSPTAQKNADPDEVFADDPYIGQSVFDISRKAPNRPFAFEGGDIIWEITAGPSDFVTNAESVSAFIHNWNVYGEGGRQYDYARSGCIPGAATWAESLNADIDFALLVNKQPCLDFTSTVIQQLETSLQGM